MPAGRRLEIKQGGTAIARCQETSISISGAGIEITDNQSSGWRTYDDDVGARSVDISISGVATLAASPLRVALLAASPTLLLTDITVEYPDGEVLSGNFWLESLEESGSATGNDPIKFSAEMKSSGVITRTPPV